MDRTHLDNERGEVEKENIENRKSGRRRRGV